MTPAAKIEQECLKRLPKLADLVSDENPVPWRTWLLENCEVRERRGRTVFYGSSNCNYIVYRGRVFRNYGYHGRVLMARLASACERAKVFRAMADFCQTMDELVHKRRTWFTDHLIACRKSKQATA